jgi:hypothetical protein
MKNTDEQIRKYSAARLSNSPSSLVKYVTISSSKRQIAYVKNKYAERKNNNSLSFAKFFNMIPIKVHETPPTLSAKLGASSYSSWLVCQPL